MFKNFGKIIAVLVLAFSLFVLVGCTKDGTISFSDQNLTMVVGDEVTLSPVLSDKALEVVYTATPADAVTFVGNKITAVKAGTVTVKATIKDTKVSATITVTITEPVVKTYAADGQYTAFEVSMHYGAPMVTYVTVTITDDAISAFYIDAVQSAAVKNEAEEITDYKFNEKSKKELGYEYGMHNTPNAEEEYVPQDLKTVDGMAAYKAYLTKTGKKDWFEQAALIEAHFVANGMELEYDENLAISNIAGVTVKDGSYSKLAKEAVAHAVSGTAISVMRSGNHDIIWVEGKVNADGSFSELELNTLQGRLVEGAYAWDTENKQEKGYLYGMHNTPSGDYVRQDLTTTEGMAAYKAHLVAAEKLEWFEQAALITDYVLANGVAGLKLEGVKLDGSVEALAGVTVTASGYVTVLKALYTAFPNA